jgi:hypothetical protein
MYNLNNIILLYMNFNLGLFTRNSSSKRVNATINLGSTKGRGSSTRMFNYCNKREGYGYCLNQFITYI